VSCMKTLCTLVAVVTVAILATTATAAQAATKLVGTVGPGFTISLKKNGVKVTTLKPGSYTFVVSDKANIHNFQLKGPGLNKAITSVSFVGTKTVTLTLKAGTYTYFCVPHQSSMHGSFKVA
jgi:plastocyanin